MEINFRKYQGQSAANCVPKVLADLFRDHQLNGFEEININVKYKYFGKVQDYDYFKRHSNRYGVEFDYYNLIKTKNKNVWTDDDQGYIFTASYVDINDIIDFLKFNCGLQPIYNVIYNQDENLIILEFDQQAAVSHDQKLENNIKIKTDIFTKIVTENLVAKRLAELGLSYEMIINMAENNRQAAIVDINDINNEENLDIDYIAKRKPGGPNQHLSDEEKKRRAYENVKRKRARDKLLKKANLEK